MARPAPSPPRAPALGGALLTVLVVALGTGCASVGDFVWVDAAVTSRPRRDADMVIAPGDVLAVRVFGQEALSTRALVRADGKISLPLVNDRHAEGLTPATLAQLLEAQYQTFIKSPVVTVVLEQRHPDQVSVLGAVAAPGTYALTPGAGVLQALALAGGITPFAGRDRIFVLRAEEAGRAPLRIRFRYRALLEGQPRSAAFALADGDVVVVE